MTCGNGREQVITRKRFLQASDGINACLPSDSGAQSISSGLITTCSTALGTASVLALQVWKGLCYLWSELQTVQSDVATIDTTLTSLQNQINNIHGMRTPGAATITVGAGAGAGASASMVGNDTASVLTLTTGTGVDPTGAPLAVVHFTTPYTTFPSPLVSPAQIVGNNNSISSLRAVPLANGSGCEIWGAPNDSTVYPINLLMLGGT